MSPDNKKAQNGIGKLFLAFAGIVLLKKAQNGIGKLFLAFAGIVLLATLLPTVQTFVGISAGNVTANGGDAGTVTLINLIPFFLVLMFIAAWFVDDRLS